MASVIKPNKGKRQAEPIVYRFEEVSPDSERCVGDAQMKAAAIVAEARQQAEEIRRQAIEEGKQDAAQSVEQEIARRMETALPIVRQAAAELVNTQQAWLRRWEQSAVQLAVKIAERIVHREIARSPQITLDLVRDALEMAMGAPQIKIRLNPADFAAMEGQVKRLAQEISQASQATIVPDEAISRGGCRLETQHGVIDQQIGTQLDRIAAELSGDDA
jgi:flagellar assembly protein FliH